MRLLFNLSRQALLLAVCLSPSWFEALAQAPTSLQYPTPNVLSVNQDNVFLSPTVAGNIVSYSITPALPAGLSFNTNTGVISGIPIAASASTGYTITATNGSGSTSTICNIQVLNFFYNNAYAQVSFLAANATPKVYSSLATAGQGVNDIVLYSNVVTIGGQAIDCIVKTIAVNNVTSWTAYDQSAASGSSFSNNSDNYFSPQVTFGGSPGGSVTFDFQFILGGTYNNATSSGTNVVLQNVYANTYDIDGNGTAIQNNEFGGFSSSELGTTTNEVVSYNATNGFTRFTSNTSANTTAVTDPKNRIRVSYSNVSNFRIVVAANNSGLAYFFIDFSAGPAFTSNTTSAPSLDLETSKSGVNNSNSGCGTVLSFTPGNSQTNLVSPSDLAEFSIQLPTASILNGASEQLKINGATSGGTIALNFANAAAIPDVVFGTSITYAVAATVSGGISKLSFTRKSGTSQFTVARAEELVDALQYQNISAAPTAGDRPFTLNVRNTLYKSPDAKFTATLNCVGISGNIYHDANALTDNTVNANSTSGQFANGSMYAVLVDPATNLVLATQAITSSAYNFGNTTPGKYHIYFSNSTPPAVGASFSASTLPAGNYITTGENLGAGAGNDLAADGKLIITVGSITVTDANFGMQIPPVINAVDEAPSLNPGGFNNKIITPANFGATDADGTISSITITSFPTNTNYIKIGSTVYTNGGTCPPQSTCTVWPGTVVVPYTSGLPSNAIAVDPIDGATTVAIDYFATDNGNANSSPATLNAPFTIPATALTITGNVWIDGDGNANVNGTEQLTNIANAGQTLYALLVQNTNTYSGAKTVYTSSPVNSTTGYTFPDVPSGNDYEIKIISLATAPVDGSAASLLTASLAAGYTGVSTNNNGTSTTGLNTNNLVNTLNVFSASVANVNFGIDSLPAASDATHVISKPAIGSSLALTGANGMSALAGTDAEDGSKGGGSTVVITNVSGMNGNQLKYNGVLVTAGTTISNYDPALLTIEFTSGGSVAAGFSFAFVDAAGVQGNAAAYSISWAVPLPVKILSFTAIQQNDVINLQWKTENEASIKSYNIQHSANGSSWQLLGSKPAAGEGIYGSTDAAPLDGTNYYRIQVVYENGSIEYSAIRKVEVSLKNKMVKAWPNPVLKKLTINPGNLLSNKIELLNTNGQVVLIKTITGTTDVNVQHLAPGLYVLRVTGADNKTTVIRVEKR